MSVVQTITINTKKKSYRCNLKFDYIITESPVKQNEKCNIFIISLS